MRERITKTIKEWAAYYSWPWAILTVILALLGGWGPYLFWNLQSGQERWWRTELVGSGVFDTYVYLHWLGAQLQGGEYGGHLKWFGGILQGIFVLTQKMLTIPEVWIVGHVLSGILLLLIVPILVEHWIGLERRSARVSAIVLWIWIGLAIGLRPGFYGWYLPFCLIALFLTLQVRHALRDAKWVQAGSLTVVALGLSYLYPWFFLFVGVYLGVIIGLAIIRRMSEFSKRHLMIGGAIATLIFAVAGGVLVYYVAGLFLSPSMAGFIGMYERNGVTFARLPLLANTILAFCAWIGLSGIFLQVTKTSLSEKTKERSLMLLVGWLSLFFLWFHVPITGIYLWPDHFIGPTAIMAWLTLLHVWHVSQRERLELTGRMRGVTMALAALGGAFTVYIFVQMVGNTWSAESYLVHVAHWMALTISASMIVWHDRKNLLKSLWIIYVGATIIFGTWGMVSVLGRGGLQDPPARLAAQREAIREVVASISPQDAICSDSHSASFLAAHTGRAIYPAEAVWSYPFSSEELLRRLEVYVHFFDARQAPLLNDIRFATDHYRPVTCAEGRFAQHGRWAKIFGLLNLDSSNYNDLFGCPSQNITHNWQRIERAMQDGQRDEQAFKQLCPSVISTRAFQDKWSLPADYATVWQNDEYILWKKR